MDTPVNIHATKSILVSTKPYTGKNKKIMRSRLTWLPLAALLSVFAFGISFSGCDQENIYDVSDTQWRIAVFWDDGARGEWTVDFYDDLSLQMVDDTATYGGNWSRNGQVISWTVEVPDRQINARCNVDRRKIEGTLEDQNDLTAIFTGDKQ